MSWKPCRGHRIGLDDAIKREAQYRMQLHKFLYQPVGYMEWSKAYYHWLVAQRDLKNAWEPRSCKIEDIYGQLISQNLLEQFAQHKEQCYKPLQKYIK